MTTTLLLFFCVVVMVKASVLTVPLTSTGVPKRLIASPGDKVHFVNLDTTRIHRISLKRLNFDTGDLYPAGAGARRARSSFLDLTNVAPGEYSYYDEYTRQLRGTLVVVPFGDPWDSHPGFTGQKLSLGPTRVVGARVAASRVNGVNEITPASVAAVAIEVALAGEGPAEVKVGLLGEDFVVVDCPARVVDGKDASIVSFVVDARSLPDGELMFEIDVNGVLFHVPGPVLKETDGPAFSLLAEKTVINIQAGI